MHIIFLIKYASTVIFSINICYKRKFKMFFLKYIINEYFCDKIQIKMLITGLLIIILSNAVSLRRDKSILYAKTGMIIFILCLIISINNFYINFIDQGIGLFGGTFSSSVITHIFHIFIFLISFLILQLNSFYPRKIWTQNYSSITNYLFNNIRYFNSFISNKMSVQYKILEYPLVLIFALIGGIFLISSGDMISIFICIELQSYALYILCALYRNSERSLSGALIYFLLGGLSSCFILLAIGLLYVNSGHTNFDSYYIITNISDLYITKNINPNLTVGYENTYKNFALAVMSIGFLFKISAAPFHFWSPDVYDAVPTIVTTFIAIFAKISILIVLLELVHFTSNNFTNIDYVEIENSPYNISWTFTLLLSSLFSLIIGSVLGLTQFRIKRLYAYSTISHLGFILLALVINTVESIQSFIFYLMQYSLSNLNAFLLLIAIGYSLYLYVDKENKNINENDILDKNNSPIQLINELRGYFYINPMLAISLAITLFSFVGVPPLIGFFAKQMILVNALDKGYIFMVLVAILSSVISACYYLALIKEIFFYNSNFKLIPGIDKWTLNVSVEKKNKEDTYVLSYKNIHLNSFLSTSISLLTLLTLIFILIPQEWLSMTTIITLLFFNC